MECLGHQADGHILVEQHRATLLEVSWLYQVVAVHHNDDVFPRHLVRVVDVWIDVAEQDVVEIGALPVELLCSSDSVAHISNVVACSSMISVQSRSLQSMWLFSATLEQYAVFKRNTQLM